MKDFLSKAMMLLLSTSFTSQMFAIATPDSNISTQVTIVQKYASDGDNIINPEEKGNRMPPLRLNCTISEAGGVQICGVQADEMLSFEVNEYASGVCVGTFFEEEEFVCSLFTLSGDYSISIETADCIYIGYVSL